MRAREKIFIMLVDVVFACLIGWFTDLKTAIICFNILWMGDLILGELRKKD